MLIKGEHGGTDLRSDALEYVLNHVAQTAALGGDSSNGD